MQTTSVRIDLATHRELKKLAAALETTVGAAVALAVRHLSQERMGTQLNCELTPDDIAWLDADLG
ncbi:MAG: hypothetical protein OXE75_01260 [bacterium]|nr:hypothetical protein [bacterium]